MKTKGGGVERVGPGCNINIYSAVWDVRRAIRLATAPTILDDLLVRSHVIILLRESYSVSHIRRAFVAKWRRMG